MASFSVEAMVRGYHVFQDIWTAVVGEEFPCKREAGNRFYPFAVAVMRSDTGTTTVIGHVPRKFRLSLRKVDENLHHKNISRYTVYIL